MSGPSRCRLALPALLLSMAAGAQPPGDALAALAFMAGHWATTTEQMRVEEFWTAPDGGIMLGVHRDVMADGSMYYELLRIELVGGVPTYVASPQGDAPTAFRLVESGACHAVFENPEQAFPRRIGYARHGSELRVHAEGTDARGQPQRLEWVWWLRSGEVYPLCE